MTLSALHCLLVGGDTGFVSLALTPELSSDARLALLVRFMRGLGCMLCPDRMHAAWCASRVALLRVRRC